MDTNLVLAIILVALVAVAAFLAAAETSLIRVRRTAVEVEATQGDRAAARLLRLLGDLALVMNTVLLAVLLAQVGAATVMGLIANDLFGNLGITLASVGLTVVMFVYAESIPKTIAVRHPLVVAKAVTVPVAALTWLLRPIVRLLLAFADLQAPGRGIAGPGGVSEQELRRLAAEAERAGEISSEDLELMERAFRFGDETVEQILVPRTDVVAIPGSAAVAEALEMAIAGGYRRIPVYEGDLDNITGVVLLRDLVGGVSDGGTGTVKDLARPVLLVPESGRVNELLRMMQEAGRHFAVAVDEHGGTAGIVTIEDVVEELLGEVADEGELRTTPIRPLGGDRWLVDARIGLFEFAEELEVEVPDGEWTTVGGLVVGLAGRIPKPGDRLEAQGLEFAVVAATRTRVLRVEVGRVH